MPRARVSLEEMAETWVYDYEKSALFRYETGSVYYPTENFVPTIELSDGVTYYLVVVTYTTGDSGGRCPDPRFCVIDAYPDEAAAEATAIAIREHDTEANRFNSKLSYDDKHALPIVFANGSKIGYGGPWLGYFEQLKTIEVIPLVANAPRRKVY